MHKRSLLIALRPAFLLIVFACASAAHAEHGVEHWLGIAKMLAPAGGAIDFTPHATQPGLVYDIQPPEPQCTACHGGNAGGDPADASTYRPFSTWSGSMMANATRDPLFFAALDIANHDMPGVGDYCLRCHTPRGWLMGRVVKPGFGPPNDPVKGAAACLLDGTYDAPDDINSDMGGVTCHFCHRLMATGPGGEPGYTDNGNAWVDDVACANTGGGPPCRRGPYAYTDGTVPPPHEWDYSAFHEESALCGTCHNVSTPDTDIGPLKTLKLADGTDTGHPFPIERTFAEWQQSGYAQAPATSCQNCHMPDTEAPDATACSLRINNRTGDMAVHAFVGGNTWVPGIIKGEYGAGLDRQRHAPHRIARSDHRVGARAARHRGEPRHDDRELHAADRERCGLDGALGQGHQSHRTQAADGLFGRPAHVAQRRGARRQRRARVRKRCLQRIDGRTERGCAGTRLRSAAGHLEPARHRRVRRRPTTTAIACSISC